MEYPSECPMNAQNGSLLVNTADDVNPLNMASEVLFFSYVSKMMKEHVSSLDASSKSKTSA